MSVHKSTKAPSTTDTEEQLGNVNSTGQQIITNYEAETLVF